MEIGDLGATDVEELDKVETVESLLDTGRGFGEARIQHLFHFLLGLDLSSEPKRSE